MVTQNPNPFILPGFGQSGDTIQNPMLASMEMMRKAWEGLASTGGYERALATPGISPEDLERRITDLRAVENWLRMNLSMLSSTIQALEVQRATVSTLQAFVASATSAANPASAPPSPLDVALGIRRGPSAAPSADSSGLFSDKTSTAPAETEPAPAAAPSAAGTAADKSGTDEASTTPSVAEGAIQTWWDMLQTQFDNLASATAATLQGAEAIQDAATAAQQQAADSTRTAADVIKKSTTKKAASAPAKKTAVKKTAVKKTVAKKAAAKKAAKKTPATKTVTPKADDKSTGADTTETVSKPATTSKSAAKKATTKKTAAKKATGSGPA